MLILDAVGQEWIALTPLQDLRNTIDLSELPAGLYWLELRTEEKRLETLKILRQ